MGSWRAAWVVGLVLVAGACATTPRLAADVETFSQLASSPAPSTVAITAFTGIDPASLEFERYRARLAQRLAARGFEVVDADAGPAYRMRLGYRVGDGRQVVDTIGAPSFRSYRYGRAGGPYDPFFDRVQVITYTVYSRHLVLVLADAASGEELWRASVLNLGRRPSLKDAFDAMVEAALADFPAEVSRRVVVTMEPVAAE